MEETKKLCEIRSSLKSAKDGGVIPPLLSQAVEHGRACSFVTSRSKFCDASGVSKEIYAMLAPNTSQVAMLWNDTNTGMVLRAREAQDASAKLGRDDPVLRGA
jgi:hypothetical protein